MLSSVEQAFVGREEIRAPLKMPAWEARGDRLHIYPSYVLVLTSMSFAIIFLAQRNSTLGGSLKFWQGSGWFCMRFHFFIKASFLQTLRVGIISRKAIFQYFSSWLFYFRSAALLSVSFTSNSNFSFKIVWLASVHQALLKSEILPLRSLFVGFSRLIICQTDALTIGM